MIGCRALAARAAGRVSAAAGGVAVRLFEVTSGTWIWRGLSRSTVIAAADVVMCASGTVALETLLVNRPMVVTYRISPATHYLAKHLKLIRPQLFSLPNILAGEKLVPELIQHESTGENLAREVRKWLDSHTSRESLKDRFLQIHERLRCDASKRAADAVSGLLES